MGRFITHKKLSKEKTRKWVKISGRPEAMLNYIARRLQNIKTCNVVAK